MLAEDPLYFNLTYLHKYFQIFIYFISQNMMQIIFAGSNTNTDHPSEYICLETFLESICWL